MRGLAVLVAEFLTKQPYRFIGADLITQFFAYNARMRKSVIRLKFRCGKVAQVRITIQAEAKYENAPLFSLANHTRG